VKEQGCVKTNFKVFGTALFMLSNSTATIMQYIGLFYYIHFVDQALATS